MNLESRIRQDNVSRMYNSLFKPGSIVVVGGSESLSKPGGKVLKNIVEHGYKGTLWVVNPGAASVSVLPSFTSIGDIPGTPELAIIVIPAPFVAAALEDLGRIGTGAAIILSSGFGEKGEEGKREEERLLAIANSAGMIMVGPNCSGFMTPHYSGKFAGIIPEMKLRSIDIISGSGATVDLIMEQAVLRGLSFCNVVNVGNSVQTGIEDLVALHDENYGDESSPILMLYVEHLKKPGLLLRHCRSLTGKGCAVVAIKSGASSAGARAAASHTGALATDDKAVEALFRKAGIIRVKSKMEMVDVACALTATGGRMHGNRVCVITDAGGPGVMASDEVERQGLLLPPLREKTQERLRSVLPSEASVANPVDCLATRTDAQLRQIFTVLEEEEKDGIDVIAIQVANPGMSHNRKIYREVLRAMNTCAIPVVTSLSSVTTCEGLIKEIAAEGMCYFPDEVNLCSAIGKVFHRPRLFDPPDEIPNYDKAAIGDILEHEKGILSSESVSGVLLKAGFRLPQQEEITSEGQLEAAYAEICFPLAMKVLGPLHKSDLGGVKVGIGNREDARSAWGKLMAIQGAAGVLIQQMVDGIEVILGVSKKGDMGHLVMFGLGGIYTEVLKDIRFALAPLAKDECRQMITGIQSFPILKGLRGQEGMSIELLVDYMERLGRLVADFPAIGEIDLNPVKGLGAELYVVDARIIMD